MIWPGGGGGMNGGKPEVRERNFVGRHLDLRFGQVYVVERAGRLHVEVM